jgi:hypothetical protein
MSSPATYEDVNLILRLYELRREPKLREARSWFFAHFLPHSAEDVARIAPPGSPENTYVRMVVSYWDMVSSFVTAGVLNQELLFQSAGELLVCWERVKPTVADIRVAMSNPGLYRNIEAVGTAYADYMRKQGPGAYETFLAMITRGVSEPDAPRT